MFLWKSTLFDSNLAWFDSSHWCRCVSVFCLTINVPVLFTLALMWLSNQIWQVNQFHNLSLSIVYVVSCQHEFIVISVKEVMNRQRLSVYLCVCLFVCLSLLVFVCLSVNRIMRRFWSDFYPNVATLRSGLCYHESVCRV